MTYYNTLVAEKLKTISEISRLNSLLDVDKRDGKAFGHHLEQLTVLKTELALINAQISIHQLSQDSPSSNVTGLPHQNSSNILKKGDIEDKDLTDSNDSLNHR